MRASILDKHLRLSTCFGGRSYREVKTSLFVPLRPPPSSLCPPTWRAAQEVRIKICIGLAPGWRAEGGRRRGGKSGEVFSRLEGGGRRAETDGKRSFYFPLGTPNQILPVNQFQKSLTFLTDYRHTVING